MLKRNYKLNLLVAREKLFTANSSCRGSAIGFVEIAITD